MRESPPDRFSQGPTPEPVDWMKTLQERPLQPPPSHAARDPQEDEPPRQPRKVDALEDEAVADMQANRQLREKYADKAHRLAASCITMWTILLGAQGVIKALTGVEMWTEKVIIAVTTGVTVSVLAAFLGVIRGLFPAKDKTRNAA